MVVVIDTLGYSAYNASQRFLTNLAQRIRHNSSVVVLDVTDHLCAIFTTRLYLGTHLLS